VESITLNQLTSSAAAIRARITALPGRSGVSEPQTTLQTEAVSGSSTSASADGDRVLADMEGAGYSSCSPLVLDAAAPRSVSNGFGWGYDWNIEKLRAILAGEAARR
jgi:hypothetical protein